MYEKESISLVIPHPRGDGRILLVRRPDDDESLPGLWGLPAASLREGESAEDGVRRAGREKLGIAVGPGRCIGEAEADRPGYRIRMRDFEARIESGAPAVPQPFGGTQYTDWRWGEPADLNPAADAGSLCARILRDQKSPA
ncbi:MAG TPA: NUDIX domain-containing protein [Thermoleophilaceae bacterium]